MNHSYIKRRHNRGKNGRKGKNREKKQWREGEKEELRRMERRGQSQTDP